MADKINRVFTRRIQPHPCEHCSETTQRPRFCRVECSRLARDKRNGVKPRKPCEAKQCVVCSAMFARPSRGDADARLCCSRDCGFVLRRWRGDRQLMLASARKDLLRWGARARAAPRGPTWQGRYETERGLRAEELAATECADCGSPTGFSGMGRRRLYCPSCSVNRCNENAKAGKRKREARLRGATVETVNVRKVFARDGWRCHLCHRPTPERLRGTYCKTAPELDHIVPLSRGGEHSYRNTACCCRECNGKKGNRIIGQMSLLAA